MKRLWKLDVLRGCAVLMVVFCHVPEAWYHDSLTRPLFAFAFRVGWTGVDLFFVLSGFLIGGLLFREYQTHGSVEIGRFLLRRGFKIYPPYYFYLAVMTAGAVVIHQPPTARELLLHAVYIQNYFWPIRFAVTWSLAVEEHFYLLMAAGFALFAGPRREGRSGQLTAVPRVVAVVTVVAMSLRAWSFGRADLKIDATHLRLDELMTGVMLGYWHIFHRAALCRFVARWRPLLRFAWLGLVASWVAYPLGVGHWTYAIGPTQMTWGYGLLLLLCLPSDGPPETAAKPAWPARALASLGVISYCVYLFHTVSLGVSQRVFLLPVVHQLPVELRLAVVLACYLTLAVVFALLVWLGLERPSLALRDRLCPSRATVVEPGPNAGAGGPSGS